MDVTSLYDGTIVLVHEADWCVPPCAVHSPSDHPLKAAPLKWSNTLVMFFRECLHGSMHPDPDSIRFMRGPMGSRVENLRATAMHEAHAGRCDGCCGVLAS